MLRTASERLLLQAALLPGEDALAAWERWQSTSDLDDAPSGSDRLLPLIHRNLEPLRKEYPDIGRLKGMRRRTWVQNQVLFRAAAEVLRYLHRAGIETMVLRGAALADDYYQDAGVRPMRNVDIAVPEGSIAESMRSLRKLEWREVMPASSAFTPGFQRVHSSLAFRNRGDAEVRVHWHVLPCCRSAETDLRFWSGSEPTDFQGVATRTLNPTDQFLYTCMASLQWTYESSFWRAADTVTILRAPAEIDSERFLSMAAENHLEALLSRALKDVDWGADGGIPRELAGSLSAAPACWSDRHEYAYFTQPYRDRTLLTWVAGMYSSHRRSGHGTFAGYVVRALRWAVVPHFAGRYLGSTNA